MPRVASDLFGMYHARLIDRCHKWQVVKRHAWEPHPRVAQEFEMPCHVWHQLFSVCTTRGKRCYRHVPRVTHGRRVRREATRGTKARRGAARAVRSHAWHLWCGGGGARTHFGLPQAGFPESGEVYRYVGPQHEHFTLTYYIRHRLKLRQSPPGATPAAESVASRI